VKQTIPIDLERCKSYLCTCGDNADQQFTNGRVWSDVAVRSQLWVSDRLSVNSLVLAVGGLSLIVFVVLMWVIVSRCRAAAAARQSNLEDKTARSLTKSNSYKSSPSGMPIAPVP